LGDECWPALLFACMADAAAYHRCMGYVLYPLAALVFLAVLFATDWWEAFVAAGLVLSPLLVRRWLRGRSGSA
jgi:hypothetical protein